MQTVFLGFRWFEAFPGWGGWPCAQAGADEEVPPPISPPREEEAIWLARIARGDDAALQHLFDKWKLPLLSFFYRALGAHGDAEDLTLEVFVRLHRAAPTYRSEAKFSTYLFTIARNLLRNERRRLRRKPLDPVAPELMTELPEPASDAARRLAETEEVFQRALTRLPEKARTALLLLHQQQLEQPAAAAILRISENALRVLLHRARRLLKQEMEALQ
ncbi:RNA polymerase sigma factor [Opitutus terrae]|uniref:RNA polymerase, sigma-24 subunit, ECF subfamily n=1 Tax=Opitutus terrae (strain DSM 11246 / JCM 15787 / PB90-1) TaxID=452637 RepID=B1ZS41_OPITP|nr:RNA polymerase sigma factor [Opitutus terrae]ACB74717.1 RNA polymerase, sigma-24 subunit, ECF subfamily [Opitutus terrae PB90-1]